MLSQVSEPLNLRILHLRLIDIYSLHPFTLANVTTVQLKLGLASFDVALLHFHPSYVNIDTTCSVSHATNILHALTLLTYPSIGSQSCCSISNISAAEIR